MTFRILSPAIAGIVDRISVPLQEVARVAALKALTRIYSYLFHLGVIVIMLALSGLALAAGIPTLQLGMLPWTGSTLITVLLLGGLAGLISLILAWRGSLRFLFLLWSLAVAFVLIKG